MLCKTYRYALFGATFALVAGGFMGKPAMAREGFCQKGISLQKIERLSGQGIGEGKLEVTVETSLPSRNVSASTAQLKLGKGGIQSPDLHIGTLWVPLDGGSYNQTLQTEVTEHEVGADKFVGGTDRGYASSQITVKCGTTETLTEKVKIHGRKTAKVEITYVIGPLEREYGRASQGLSPGGLLAPGAKTVTYEPNTNRGGQDYQNFDLNSANPGLCAQECAEEKQCKAYTYVPPGVQGSNARCWLKDGVPGKTTNKGLVSGVKVSVNAPDLNNPPLDHLRNF